MPDSIPTLLQYQQGNDVAPPPEGFVQVTNPLNPNLRSGSRLQHFPDDVYDLSAESHIVRLMKALLGDAGVGAAQKQMLLTRLQQSMSGTHFFDLDAFYGTLFGANRRSGAEVLLHDPYAEAVPIEEWDQARMRDGAYRNRVVKMSQAIHLGATSLGIRKFAEAMTGFSFDLIEDWKFGAYQQHSWEDWEDFTWTELESLSWDEMEFSPVATTERVKNVVTLHPSQAMTTGERFDLERALDRVRPANIIVIISDDVPEQVSRAVPFTATSSSEKWEIRQLVQNSRIRGILPYPNHPEDEFISPPVPAWSGYSGEAWTLLDRSPRALAYFTKGRIQDDIQIDPKAADLVPQEIPSQGVTRILSLAEYATLPVQGLYGGRSASDGIVASNPYASRTGDQTGLYLDRVPYEFVSESVSISSPPASRFWTTPARPAEDETNEVLELRFSEPINFNHISFKYARFPCTIIVQFWDRSVGRWQTLEQIIERESSPAAIGNTPPPGSPHPFHQGAGHWEKRSISFTSIVARNIRFVLRRTDGFPPVDTNKSPMPYPLGVKDLDVGFRVNREPRVPHVPASASMATSKNAVGLKTRYYLDRAMASNVEDSLPSAWISEPQPIRDAVVNLYLAVGDGTFPSVVNQIYLDPVYSGATVNLYSTRSVPRGTAEAAPRDEVVVPSSVVGSVNPISGGNAGLTLGQSEPAYIDIDTTTLGGASAGGNMWIGASYEFLGFDVAEHFGKYTTIVSAAIPDGHLAISHGLDTVIEAGLRRVRSYTIFITINGTVMKIAFPTGRVPAPNEGLKIFVRADGTPTAYAQLGLDDILSAEVIHEDLSRGVSALFNPLRDRRPPDWYEQRARRLPLVLRAAHFAGGADWVNTGSQPSVSTTLGSAVFLGDRSRPSGWFAYLPGEVYNNNNWMRVTHKSAFATATNTGSFYVRSRIQPISWAGSAGRYVCGTLPEGTSTGNGWGFGLSSDGRLEFTWGAAGEHFTAKATVGIDHDLIDPLEVAMAMDDDTVSFFWRKNDSSLWHQVGESINTDLIQGGATSVTHSTRSFSIGRGGSSGTSPSRVFHGAIFGLSFGKGTPGLGHDIGGFPLSVEVDLNDQDFASSRLPGTDSPLVEMSVGGTAELMPDTQGNTSCPVMLVCGPAMVMQGDSDAVGITVMDDQVGDLSFDKWLTAAGLFNLPFSRSGKWPLLTKRNGNSPTSKGWGVYVNNGDIIFEASDGTAQTSLSPAIPYVTLSGTSSYIEGPATPQFNFSDGIDITARISLDGWDSTGVDGIATNQGGWSFQFDHLNSALWLEVTVDGVTYTRYSTITPPADGQPLWVRCTHTPVNGSTRFFTSPNQSAEPQEDQWQLIADVNGSPPAIGKIDDSTSPIRVGVSDALNSSLDGDLYAIFVRDHRGDVGFQTTGGDLPLSGATYTTLLGHPMTIVGGTINSWSVAPDSTSTGGGVPFSIAVHTLPSAARVAASQLGGQVSFKYTEGATGEWAGLVNFTTSAPVRILSDSTTRTPGVVHSVFLGSGAQASNINHFTNLAGSLSGAGTVAAIGSSWTVVESGAVEGVPVARGDVLFEHPTRTVDSNGSINPAGESKSIVKGSTIRYGSPARMGSSLKVIGSAVGYGAGPGRAYIDSPDRYSVVSISNDRDGVRGTFLRYHPSYLGWDDGDTPSIGFMGGPVDAWGAAVWEPIGQFALTQGNVNFPDVVSVGLKLEFTNLSPEPYETFIPIDREVSRLSPGTPEALGRSREQIEQRMIELLTVNRFPDSFRPTFYGQDARVNLVSPTTGLAIIDGSIQDSIAERYGSGLNYQEWQTSFRSGINAEAGVHQYNVTNVQAISRTAFFMGLRTVDVRRTSHRARFDDHAYLDTLYDADDIDLSKTTFDVEPGQIFTPTAPTSSIMIFERRAQSKPYYSRTPVTALQFATQQTPPTQVVPDDEFRSPDLFTQSFTGETQWHRVGDSIVFWDQGVGTVRVTRDPAVLDAFYAPDSPIVQPPVHPILSSGFGRVVQLDSASSGGISSPTVSISPKGVVFVATRVAAHKPMSAPLWLRAYDSLGRLLAQKSFTPEVGSSTEVTMAITSARPGDYGIQVRVEQDGPYMDSWMMYALSAFDQGILWEFSNDGGESWVPGYTARNLLYGVVDFPRPGASLLWRCTAYRYNSIVDAIQLRPWYQNRIGASL